VTDTGFQTLDNVQYNILVLQTLRNVQQYISDSGQCPIQYLYNHVNPLSDIYRIQSMRTVTVIIKMIIAMNEILMTELLKDMGLG
jgi:hypothetical protein